MKTTIVMVVYKQKLENCKTFQTMLSTGLLNEHAKGNMQVIVYDNSPEPQQVPAAYESVLVYKHDPRNLGIATAYNYALELAKEHNSDWMVLLDHDTKLTKEYVTTILSLEEISDPSVAAFVPKIYCHNEMISPVFSGNVQPLRNEKPTAGLQDKAVMSINSGSAISVALLNSLGGFNEDFPLDYLDHWLFHEMYEKGYKVFVLDISLDHELSVMNYNTVSLKRYESILGSEIRFYKGYKQDLLKRYKKQLLLRATKQLVVVKNKKIALHTFRQMKTV